MKMPTIIKRKKLRAATAARRSRAGVPAIEYEEMSEPNMKLSRALLIVLLLHVVAVAGIVAFNTIKTREAINSASPDPVPATPKAATTEPAPAAPDEMKKVADKTETNVAATVSDPVKGSATPADPPKPERKITTIADSGRTYTVVKGDNPVTIARHFHVDYSALLELNEITDPRKLQIGAKLHIPEREEGPKHKSD